MIELIKLLPFNNVVASGVAICDLVNLLGFTIETIFLQLGGGSLTKAMLTSVQLKANGKTILDSTGSAIDSRMQYRGLTANAAFLPIDFTEVRGRTKNALLSGGFDTTVGVKNLRLEVAITGATTPTLAGFASVSAPMVAPEFAAIRPLIARVHRATQTIGAAGQFALSVPHLDPAAGGSVFKRIVVFSAQMNGLLVVRNGINEHESVKALNDYRQQYEGLRSPQANVYVFDPIIDNFQEDRVFDTRQASGTQTAQFLGTFAAGETITIESEVLEPLDVY
jgi:hypothetical protein